MSKSNTDAINNAIRDKIFKLIDERGLNNIDLAEYLGIDPSTVSSWKKKTYSFTKYLSNIAKFFNVPLSYFQDEDSENTFSSDEFLLIQNYRTLSPSGKQLILNSIKDLTNVEASIEASKELTPQSYPIKYAKDKVSAGKGYNLNNNDLWEKRKIVCTKEAEEADFAVSVEGISMLPDYEDGDVVLVKSQNHIEIGQIGIFTMGDEGYIKQYGKDYLISLNPDCSPVYPTAYEKPHCWGLVIGKATLLDD